MLNKTAKTMFFNFKGSLLHTTNVTKHTTTDPTALHRVPMLPT